MTALSAAATHAESLAVRIAPLERANLDEASKLLATSFVGDPFVRTIMPHEASRRRALPWSMRGELIESMHAGGALGAYEGSKLVGVGVTFPFGTRSAGLTGHLKSLPSYAMTAVHNWRNLPRMIDEARIAARHTPTDPHAYIGLLAVDPALQGRGVGSQLLKSALAQADRGGHPAFIETSNPRNVPLYERMGFTTIDTFASRGTTNWNMWRTARDAS